MEKYYTDRDARLGKEHRGRLLAKRLGYRFLDSDLLIQEQEGRLLKQIIEDEGLSGFLAIEEQVNRDICAERTVIAPGGSVIYGPSAMEHLKEISTVVYLKLGYGDLERRLGNLKDRGVALKDGMTLRELYEERVPLYEKYARRHHRRDREDQRPGGGPASDDGGMGLKKPLDFASPPMLYSFTLQSPQK